MTKRKLFFVLGAALLMLAIILGSVLALLGKNAAQKQGQMVFAETFDKGVLVDKIKITTAEDTITLVQKNSYWFVEEKGLYYADFATLQKLLISLNESVYAVKLPLTDEVLKEGFLLEPKQGENNSGLLIQTYIGEEMLDEMIVGKADAGGNYFFARTPDENAVWLIDGDFRLPVLSEQWLLRPILASPEDTVESVSFNGKSASREEGVLRFETPDGSKANVFPLLDVLKRLTINNAMKKEVFEAEKMNNLSAQPLEIVTFFGLKFDCVLYTSDTEMWIKINLATTPLPKASVNNYIKETRFLYDDWYFSISPTQQRILRHTKL